MGPWFTPSRSRLSCATLSTPAKPLLLGHAAQAEPATTAHRDRIRKTCMPAARWVKRGALASAAPGARSTAHGRAISNPQEIARTPRRRSSSRSPACRGWHSYAPYSPSDQACAPLPSKGQDLQRAQPSGARGKRPRQWSHARLTFVAQGVYKTGRLWYIIDCATRGGAVR
jgi:hypothetical protein